jgi:hypothetical protein
MALGSAGSERYDVACRRAGSETVAGNPDDGRDDGRDDGGRMGDETMVWDDSRQLAVSCCP